MKKGADRLKILRQASEAVSKAFGAGKSVRASIDLAFPSVWASTGSLMLDWIIAGQIPGGVPMGPKRGRLIHVYGLWSLGKSVLVDMVAKAVQLIKGLNAITETEGSRDAHFADAIGLDLEEVEIQRPDTIEELFDLFMTWHDSVRKQDKTIPVFWGVDSLESIEANQTWGIRMSGKQGGAYEFGGGRQGKISAGLRKIANLCGKYPTSVMLINQIRARPGAMFGKKTGSTSGNAPKFYASAEIELTPSLFGIVKQEDGRAVGRWIHACAEKNKISPPYAQGNFLIDFNRGVLRWAGVAESLADRGVILVQRKELFQGKLGRIIGNEFTVVKTGEVLPLTEFTAWCEREKVL